MDRVYSARLSVRKYKVRATRSVAEVEKKGAEEMGHKEKEELMMTERERGIDDD